MLLPFGQTLLLWRRHRSLTQAQLAQTAGLPRPNLCAIEQGRREVSLTTLRALANALNVPAGTLVDGAPPGRAAPLSKLSRQVLERIADAIASGRSLPERRERELADLLRAVTNAPIGSTRTKGHRQRVSKRRAEAAWLTLHARYPRDLIHTLLERIEGRRRLHESQSN